jgi:hypothetical protein
MVTVVPKEALETGIATAAVLNATEFLLRCRHHLTPTQMIPADDARPNNARDSTGS